MPRWCRDYGVDGGWLFLGGFGLIDGLWLPGSVVWRVRGGWDVFFAGVSIE